MLARDPTTATTTMLLCTLTALALAAGPLGGGLPDLSSVPADLQVPAVELAEPAPGRRVRQTLPGWRDGQIHHTLYLPSDWQPGQRYPVIVDYAGNGDFHNAYGDVSNGTVEGSCLGYGLSGGRGCLWLCLPYVNLAAQCNQPLWWGDVPATVDYCRQAVRHTCEQYGGDPGAVILAGFSRGAIACGYLGLHDDDIADVWLGFVAYSHYDGVRRWRYPADDRDSARQRLARLRGRASFICQEGGTSETEAWLREAGVAAPFTFAATGFRNHNDAWTLRPSPARAALRAWLADLLARRPGTRTLRGRITTAGGAGVAGVLVESGATHFTYSDAAGRYELHGLLCGSRTVRAAACTPAEQVVGPDGTGEFRWVP